MRRIYCSRQGANILFKRWRFQIGRERTDGFKLACAEPVSPVRVAGDRGL